MVKKVMVKLNKNEAHVQLMNSNNAERFFSEGKEWFFFVRGNKQQGPYPSKEHAEQALKTYISETEINNVKNSSRLKRNSFNLC